MAIPGRGDYVAGRFVAADPSDGEIVSRDPGDLDAPSSRHRFRLSAVDDAVEAARCAWPAWADRPAEERQTLLRRFADALSARAEEAAGAITGEMGKTLREARLEVQSAVAKVGVTIDESLRFVAPFEVPGGRCRYRARGVLAVIGPFNFPLHLPNGHIVPALATGNCVVLKPSAVTPGVSQIMAECWDAAGLPAGVFNLVQGESESGARLARHPDVGGVLFTGSWETGELIRASTREQPEKILALEMGGKNAAIVLADADIDRAIAECFLAAFQTTGQRCTSTSRLILDRAIADHFVDRFISIAKGAKIGYGGDPETFMGPLATEGARERFFSFMDIARREGAETLLEAVRPDTPRRGCYVTPALHRIEAVDASSRYQQEEIFGPDVSALIVDGLEEALLAQDVTSYGLALSIFTRSRAAYDAAFLRSQVGTLNWNKGTAGASSRLPFGGRRRSGNNAPSALLAPVYCTWPVASLETEEPFDPKSLPPGVPWPGDER